MILETSFLIDLLKGEEKIDKWIEKLDSNEEIPILNPITAMKLWEGVHLSDRTEDELEKIKSLLKGLNFENFDIKDGKLSGKINADLTKEGEKIDIEDVMIASIAINSNQSVLTGNPDHFNRIERIEVETY